MDDLTDRELQSLRNLGNEAERAADEIDRLRAQIAALQATFAEVHADAERWAAECNAHDNAMDDYRAQIAALQAENGRLSALAGPSGRTLAELESINDGLITENERLEAERDALRARLDAIMLEHCPDEMTPEQVAEWARHQVPVDAARGAEGGSDATPTAAAQSMFTGERACCGTLLGSRHRSTCPQKGGRRA